MSENHIEVNPTFVNTVTVNSDIPTYTRPHWFKRLFWSVLVTVIFLPATFLFALVVSMIANSFMSFDAALWVGGAAWFIFSVIVFNVEWSRQWVQVIQVNYV